MRRCKPGNYILLFQLVSFHVLIVFRKTYRKYFYDIARKMAAIILGLQGTY